MTLNKIKQNILAGKYKDDTKDVEWLVQKLEEERFKWSLDRGLNKVIGGQLEGYFCDRVCGANGMTEIYTKQIRQIIEQHTKKELEKYRKES